MLQASGIFSLCAFTALTSLVYQFVLRSWFYFSVRNVKFVRGMPVLGSAYKAVLRIEPAAVAYRRCYERFPGERFVGIFDVGGRPSYLIRDPDLVHRLLADSDHLAAPANLFGRAPLSAARARSMHALMVKSSELFIRTLKQNDKIAKVFDARDLFTRYANDVIAATAFGVEADSMRDDGEFYKVGTEFGYIEDLKFLASLSFPAIAKLLDRRQDRSVDFMRKVVRENIEARRKQRFVRHDVIDLFMSDGQSDDELAAQCLAFFLGGLSSVSGTACFMFHELALNPDIQSRLHGEIEAARGGELTWELLSGMKYLDMVLSETLRRWSPVPFLERTCRRPCALDDKLELRPGDAVLVPTYALHMDERHFPNPAKFDPERFSDGRRETIHSATYLPFGADPGDCIGPRFTVMAVKTLAFHLLAEFFVDKSFKTQDPLKLKALAHHLDAEKGFFVELRRRQPDRTPFKSQIFD